MSALIRWYCPRCGIVRDLPADTASLAPYCRHNALDLPAARMNLISASHPYAAGESSATGPLPWGTDDPSRSDA